jgi:hypothetical protein
VIVIFSPESVRSHLNIGFWFNPPEADMYHGGADYLPRGRIDVLNRGTNKKIGTKDFFEITIIIATNRR